MKTYISNARVRFIPQLATSGFSLPLDPNAIRIRVLRSSENAIDSNAIKT